MDAQTKLKNFKESCEKNGFNVSMEDFKREYAELKKVHDMYGVYKDPCYYIAVDMNGKLHSFVTLPWHLLKQLHLNFRPYTLVYLSELETFVNNN